MKKLFTIILVLTISLLPTFAFAQTLRGEALWAISAEQRITGVLSPDQVENYFGPQYPTKPYIRGFLENGMAREKGLQRYVVSTSGQHGGFTTLNTTITIFSQYEEIVAEVVTDKCEYTPDSVMDYIFATMYTEDEYVGHVFFKANTPTFYVGNIIVNNGKDTIKLYMGDWDTDGNYDLGFAAGWTQCIPEPEPEPVKDPTPIIVKTCQPTVVVTPPATTIQKCCAPFLQFNLFSIVKNCFQKCR